MSDPIQKEEKEPSLFGVFLNGITMACIGALLGFVFLTASKAEVYATTEDRLAAEETRAGQPTMPSHVYYMEGPRAGGAGWEIQRSRLLTASDGEIVLSMGELNAWMASRLRPSRAPKKDDQSNLMIIPGTPNFFADTEGILSVNLPTEVIIFGKTYKYVISGRGHFSEDGSATFAF
ncbi:MAG: hypothetical protein AAGC73_09555, partial [Verrucomicrobiota bacterium]